MSTKLTGITLPKKNFRLHETTSTVEVNQVFEVLKGNLAAYRIRQYLTPQDCQQIVSNFWASAEKVPRLGIGEYGVEGYFIGASHIEKTTEEYLRESLHFKHATENLFTGTINPINSFRNLLVSQGNEYTNARPAQLNGLCAGDLKAIYWSNTGEFLLSPHDDLAQLSDPLQKGFEIQDANRVMAINFYPTVPSNAGQLRIWNIDPDNASKENLGLQHSGFPYPPELLNEIEHLTIPVETGDLCVINGNLIHAVMKGDANALSKDRLLLTCFMTFNQHKELVWWT